MKENPKTIGERSEAVILAKFLLRGEIVLQPFGDNQRYDLVLDCDGTFTRVQCKTGRLKNGAVSFPCCSMAGGKVRRSYVGDIEAFAIYCPDNDKVYFVPVEHAPKNEMTLRIDPPKNNSAITTVRWAIDYEI